MLSVIIVRLQNDATLAVLRRLRSTKVNQKYIEKHIAFVNKIIPSSRITHNVLIVLLMDQFNFESAQFRSWDETSGKSIM